jgi:hypothetical protein
MTCLGIGLDLLVLVVVLIVADCVEEEKRCAKLPAPAQ